MPVIPENIINLSTNTVPETVIEIDIDDVGRVFVIEAKAQADRAQEYAETSASYVSRAEIAAGRAEASETSATASATSASASATSATASATTASTDADRAETAATSATSDADRAEAARDAAEDLIPGEGLVGDFLQKTVDGAQWATIPGGGAIWGGITGTLDNQSDLRDRLDTKITAPATGSTGQLLSKTADGTQWVDAPNSAVWGLIQGNLSDQTDVYNAINAKGSVNTVNGIQPNAQKNVQVDVELTQAQYDALPATKLTNNVNYFIKDGAYHPQGSVIDAEGVMYDNTESGLTSDTVQGAIDENASAIEELNNGFAYIRGYFKHAADWTDYNAYPTGFNRTNCSIVGFEVYNADSWKNGIGYTATQNARTFAAMDNNGVRVYNTDTVLFGEVYRITLRKLTI